ncbi:hypothetical protein DOY81_012833, partial [Sarcophaga bullata]
MPFYAVSLISLEIQLQRKERKMKILFHYLPIILSEFIRILNANVLQSIYSGTTKCSKKSFEFQ